MPRLGTCGDLLVAPILWGLAEREVPHQFELLPDSLAANGIKLRSGSVEATLLAPIDYARSKGETRIVPQISVTAAAGGSTAAIFFRKGLRDITSLAVDVNFPSEAVLAKVVLAEQYGLVPEFIPASPPLARMLEQADAALLVGEAAWQATLFQEPSLDLIEAWEEMTELPFVHVLIVAQERALSADDIHALQLSARIGASSLHSVATTRAGDIGVSEEALEEILREYLSFDLDETAIESLGEFFRYAYYHGAIDNLRELKFYELPGRK